MADPENPGEKPEEEMVSIPKSEFEAEKKRLANAEGYTARKLEERDKEWEARLNDDGDDGKKQIAGALELSRREKDLAAREERIRQTEMENIANNYAIKLNVDASEFAGCKSVEEMKGKALDLALERKPQESSKFETSSGGGTTDSDADFVKRFGAGELPVTKATMDRYNKIINS